MEVWKDVVGYEGLYQVSSIGRVKSFAKNHIQILKSHIKRGYLCVYLFKDNKTKVILLHRLIGIAFIPNPDNKPQIDHINRNRLDNSISNLRWVSRSENCINRTYIESNTGYKYIRYDFKKKLIRVYVRRLNISKFFHSSNLAEAIAYRNKMLGEDIECQP